MSHPKRGEIYWVNLDPTLGAEIKKRRPCLIISNDKGNCFGQTVIVIPLTSNTEKIRSFEALVETPQQKSKAICPQLRCIDKQRLLGNSFYTLTKEELMQVETALKVALAIG